MNTREFSAAASSRMALVCHHARSSDDRTAFWRRSGCRERIRSTPGTFNPDPISDAELERAVNVDIMAKRPWRDDRKTAQGETIIAAGRYIAK
jgi:hypothetical protein